MKNSVVYIATDRLYARRLRLYGGYNRMPNMERMAKSGTIYNNATATAGSTIMTHACEWSGKYPAELHADVPFEERDYLNFLPKQDSVFHDFISMGYNVYIVLVENLTTAKTTTNGKITAFAQGYDSFRPNWNLWPEEAEIVKLPGKGREGEDLVTRRDQIMKAAELVDASEKEGKPAFVFIKCHGYNLNQGNYLRYAEQQRVTSDDLYNCEIDEGLGHLLDHYGYPSNSDAPTIWFASDHGSWMGESFRNHYGYHLHQEIVHVPLIGSRGGGRVVDNVFSMKEVRRIITDNSPKMAERYIFAETLYPGQITEKPDDGIPSTARIMVRLNRYKYIYSMHGVEGDGGPCEELYDLAYDPREKFNLAEAFNRTHKDVARPSESGPPFHHVSSRLNSNVKKALKPGILPKNSGDVEFKNTFQLSGWQEIHTILLRLRNQAKEYWTNTGRGEYFQF